MSKNKKDKVFGLHPARVKFDEALSMFDFRCFDQITDPFGKFRLDRYEKDGCRRLIVLDWGEQGFTVYYENPTIKLDEELRNLALFATED